MKPIEKSTKVHRHLVLSVVNALQIIFEQGYFADKVIEKTMRSHPKWGGRDRRFFAESVYEIVRWKKLVNYCLGREVGLAEEIRSHDLWDLFAVWWYLEHEELPEGLSFDGIDTRKIQERFAQAQQIRHIRESIPVWMDRLGSDELAGQWNEELQALNKRASVVLRANTLLTTRESLQKHLQEEGISTTEEGEDGLVLTERKNVFATNCFKLGHFEVQDASSQQVARFMKLAPGMRVVDACAGAGGKSLHIAALLKNKGKLIAMDIEERKLPELKKRARRAKVDVIETKLIEGSKTIKRLENSADRVLLDVPCTGLGVLKRNPDSKWKLTEEKYKNLLKTQQEILTQYCKMTKKGGYLIYATCSLLPSENRKQIQKFLEKSTGEWELEEDRELYPSISGFDGFYMARLKRLE